MGAQGTASLNFGAYPGANDASVAVIGQGAIVAGSLVEAWLRPEATADHSADEHRVEEIRVNAGNIAAGTGFTIYGCHTGMGSRPGSNGNGHRLYGVFSVAWVWA